MKHSNTELIVERYYRLKNWLVEKDIPIQLDPEKHKHWSDLDILAVRNEVHLISCKDALPDNKDVDKVIKNLKNAVKSIVDLYPIVKNKNIKLLYIYDVTGIQALDKLKQENIETIHVKEIAIKYIKELDNQISKFNYGRKDIPKGKRYYLIGTYEGLDKMLIYLLNNNLLNDNQINEWLKKNDIPSISKIK